MIAIISDIHANLEALQAVLQDIRQQNIQSIYCLGDVIGYGPNPIECLELSQQWDEVLLGNHEEAVMYGKLEGFNPQAAQAIRWTRELLKPRWYSSFHTKSRWEQMNRWATVHHLDNCYFVHASPRKHTTEYILKGDSYEHKLKPIFELFTNVCFVGHTHRAGIFTDDGRFLTPKEFQYTYPLGVNETKLIINVGSVGQPRDGDARACYCIYRGDRVEYRRVAYDYQATIKKIQRIPELSDSFAERLLRGA